VSKFQDTDTKAIIYTAFEASSVSGADTIGFSQRLALVQRIFRLCTPIALHVAASAGLAQETPLVAFLASSARMWHLAECRDAFGMLRCLWLAPQIASGSPDVVPKKLAQKVMRMLHNDTKRVRRERRTVMLLTKGVRTLDQALSDMLADLLPLWETAARRLGFAQSLAGVARLHRAVIATVRRSSYAG